MILLVFLFKSYRVVAMKLYIITVAINVEIVYNINCI